MKRTILFFILALCAITLVSAQGNNRRGQGFPGEPKSSWGRGYQRNSPPSPEETSVSGNLTIAQGMIAVIDKDTTYLAMGLNRFVGFIDGFKEGAAVTLEGYALANPQEKNVKCIHVQKMSLNGKEYDLARTYQQRNPYQRSKQQPQHRGRW